MQMQQLLGVGTYKWLSVLLCKKRLCCREEGEDAWRGSGSRGSTRERMPKEEDSPFGHQRGPRLRISLRRQQVSPEDSKISDPSGSQASLVIADLLCIAQAAL